MRQGSSPEAMPRVNATSVTTTLGPGCDERHSAPIAEGRRPAVDSPPGTASRVTTASPGQASNGRRQRAMPMMANTRVARYARPMMNAATLKIIDEVS